MKIIKVMSTTRKNLSEGILQIFCYVVVRVNNVVCEFSVPDFPLMNLNNLVNVTSILINVDVLKLAKDKMDDFRIDFAHIKVFIDS